MMLNFNNNMVNNVTVLKTLTVNKIVDGTSDYTHIGYKEALTDVSATEDYNANHVYMAIVKKYL